MPRFNYTNRKKISSDTIILSILDNGELDIKWQKKLTPHYPKHAQIIVEAMSSSSTTVERFTWGFADNPMPPKNKVLAKKDELYFFNIKIIDISDVNGKILGVAKQLRLANESKLNRGIGYISLLPVSFTDIGDQVWRCSFKNDNAILEINSSYNLTIDFVTNNIFFTLVFPQAIRRIMFQILTVDIDDDLDLNNTDSWKSRWIKWGIDIHPSHDDPTEFQQENDDYSEDVEDWIDSVANEFCKKHKIKSQFEDLVKGEINEIK